jgi:outer membrane PBP1 activator LpoA protein
MSSDSELDDSEKLDLALKFSNVGNFRNSMDRLLTINPQNLNNRQYISYNLLSIENYIALYEMESAAQQMQQPRFTALMKTQGITLRRHLLDLETEIQLALGNYDQALNTLLDRAKTLKRKKTLRKAHDQIWNLVSQLPYQYLKQDSQASDAIMAGWLELATSSREYQNHPQEQQPLFSQWKKHWKSHPAAKTPPRQFSQGNTRMSGATKVALLLPLQDEYQIPSQTLIDGFLDAYYHAKTVPTIKQKMETEIRIYDSSNQSIIDVYNRAVEQGAELIIGPMRQSEVEELSNISALPIPTISLNRLDNKQSIQTDNLYQFGLSPIDELRQIADRAWRKGIKNVLLVSPDTGWGEQSAEFFTDYWTAKGGKLLEDVRYLSSVNDFTKLLKKPLEIDLSEQRGLYIKRFINSRVQYTARRRQDIDLVVMLGYPLKARQIKPALDFLYASNIPVIATSHTYNGDPQEELDRDLSGVEFSSMPWTLSGHLPKNLNPDKQLHTAYRHLYALGYDSFLVYRNLRHLEQTQMPPIYGSTGLLSLQDGLIVREPKWAKFEQGKVIEIP